MIKKEFILLNPKKQKGSIIVKLILFCVFITTVFFYCSQLGYQKWQQHRLKNTAKQMNQILQSGLVYIDAFQTAPTTHALLKNSYLTHKQLCSTWPGESGNEECENKANFQIKQFENFLTVSLQLTNNSDAQTLYHLLPTATLNPKNNTVTYYYPLTQGINNHEAGWLMSAGIVDAIVPQQSNQSAYAIARKGGGRRKYQYDPIYLPKCPVGFEGHYLQTPAHFTNDAAVFWSGQPWAKNFSGSYNQIHYTPRNDKELQTADGETPTISLYSYRWKKNQDFQVSEAKYLAYFLTFCIPDGTWHNNAFKVPFDQNYPGINSGHVDAQDGQCQENDKSNYWGKYNRGKDVLPCNAIQ